MAKRSDIDWPAVFAWADENNAGLIRTAHQFQIAVGTVGAAFHRRRAELRVKEAEAATLCSNCGGELTR